MTLFAAKPAPKTTTPTPSIAEKPAKKTTFHEWFKTEKDSLEDEFPELSEGELVKEAMKRFKEYQQNSAVAPAGNGDDVPPRVVSKRKLDECKENTQAEVVPSSQLPADGGVKKAKGVTGKARFAQFACDDA